MLFALLPTLQALPAVPPGRLVVGTSTGQLGPIVLLVHYTLCERDEFQTAEDKAGYDMDDHFDLFDRLTGCQTTDELATALTVAAGRYGFTYWMYALDLPIGQKEFLLSNYPAAWIDLYSANKYLQSDPAVEHCHRHITPYVWPELKDRPPVSRRVHAAWRMFREAREFGLNSGLSIPLRGLGCNWGLLSLATPSQLSDFELHALMPIAQLLACYTHEAGHRFAQGESLPPRPALTNRELECLRWAADGNTSWEIGRLIGVSERTVVFHLANATHKLGFFSRQPAIARAVALGLVTPALRQSVTRVRKVRRSASQGASRKAASASMLLD